MLSHRRSDPTSPRAERLSDSHIWEGKVDTVFDGMEVGEADAHDFGTRLAVVAGPAAKACDDPGGEGQGSLGMRISLPLGLAFKLGRDGFEDGLVVRIKGIAQELIGVAVSRLHELLDSDGSNRS